jgi:Tfp pilus assembly PilM family ATPase
MFLTKGNNYPIGLDFSDLSLKFVQLKKSRDRIEVQSLNKIVLPPKVMDKGDIKNDDALLGALGQSAG